MTRPVTLELLDQWLKLETEHETLEFKAGTKNYPKEEVVRYSVGIANKKGGYLVLGVSDRSPRRVVGSNSFATKDEINAIKLLIRTETTLDVEITELLHIDGRVLVFIIPSRPPGVPIQVRGAFLTRSGESLLPMSHEEIRAIHAETDSDWLAEKATQEITAELDRKFPRFVIYDGINKLKTKGDYDFDHGYAVGFKDLVEKVYDSALQNYLVEKVIRTSMNAYPIQALRELTA